MFPVLLHVTIKTASLNIN